MLGRENCRSQVEGQIMYYMKKLLNGFKTKEIDGVGIIEIILILVILIGLVLIFKTEITKIIQDAWAAITGDTGTIMEEITVN
jgi:hypothetical protein